MDPKRKNNDTDISSNVNSDKFPDEESLIQFTIKLKERMEATMTEEAKVMAEIKDKVVLLFLQEFKDEYTEQRLKAWEKIGRYVHFNEAASTFAQNGGWFDIYAMAFDWDSPKTIEGDTIPIIELLKILQTHGEVVIKSHRRKVSLGEGPKKLLSTMIENWLNPIFNPQPSSEERDECLPIWEAREDKVDFPWTEELDRTKALLKKWHEKKIKYPRAVKKEGYYYAHWYDIIPWTESQNETDKMVFLYRLGCAFGLCEEDTSLDLSYYQDRKSIADSIKYKIKCQKDWEKRRGK